MFSRWNYMPVRSPERSTHIRDCLGLYWETWGVADSVLRESCIPNTTRSGNMKQNSSQVVFFFLWDMKREGWLEVKGFYIITNAEKKKIILWDSNPEISLHPSLLRLQDSYLTRSECHTASPGGDVPLGLVLQGQLDVCRLPTIPCQLQLQPQEKDLAREARLEPAEEPAGWGSRMIPTQWRKKELKLGQNQVTTPWNSRQPGSSGKHARKPHFHNRGNRSCSDISCGSRTGSIMHINDTSGTTTLQDN